MIILHAGLEDGRLLLWGESPPGAIDRSAPRLCRPRYAGPRRRRRRHARLLVVGVALRRRVGCARTVPPRRPAIASGVASPLAAGPGGRRRAAPRPVGAGHAA